MSRIQQDQFVEDEEEECCPLCVEEFDLSDKNFRPCPCGYQICQFCFNNIKTTMNGLCPACRRPYDESTIEFRNITPEEVAKYKQQAAQKAKKSAQARQKEAQKAEADSLSRKHLSGLRVIQKNLVYVTGLTPTIREDRLLDTLRGPEYFGQYGKIIKIVVSKARENAQHQQSVGVYVTFQRKEDAASCISAVDGSVNGDRTLRAQYGTTKYCSAYLRNDQCNNRNCMFLHEAGEANDSFTRQDLSVMNSMQTQQPSQSRANAAPPPHHGPPVAAAATPMNRQDSSDAPSPTTEAPGLPATANWGSKVAQERRASRSTSASNPSPMTTSAVPAQASKPVKSEEAPKKKGKEKEKSAESSKSATPQRTPATEPVSTVQPSRLRVPGLDRLLKAISDPDFKFVFSGAGLSAEDLKAIVEFPPLLEPDGGAKRRARREKEKELEVRREAEVQAVVQSQVDASGEQEEAPEATAGGSLQLGGEPEERHDAGQGNRNVIAPPGQNVLGGALFGQDSSIADDFSNLGLGNRNLTPQQQQQLLSSFKSSAPPSASLLSNFQSNQSQQNPGLPGNTPGHARHASRFSFANDSASASASVHPVANQKLMSQQSSMMPKNTNHFNQLSQHQPLSGQFYTSGVQGPPPGLKATGTPPVSGGGMFGQGHGFATGGLGYGANTTGRNNNDAMYQDLLRGRNIDGARVADTGKHDQIFCPEEEASFNVDTLVNDAEFDDTTGISQILEQPRRTTPTIPPGFSAPAMPNIFTDPSPRPMSRNAPSVTPAVPVIPVTPKRTEGHARSQEMEQLAEPVEPRISNAAPLGEALSGKPATPTKRDRNAHSARPQAGSKSSKMKDGMAAITEGQGKMSPSSESHSKATSKSRDIAKKIRAKDTKSSPQKDTKKVVVPAETPVASKRQHPGKLDIAAATKISEFEQPSTPGSVKTDAQPKGLHAISLTSTGSVPPSPVATSTGSPVKRSTAPRTLRVLPTPKMENPPPLSAISSSSLPYIPTVGKLRSRQASIASVNQPGTPASELISDTASITSASISRANSPPPVGGKVGSAPVRKKTKSKAKKERQERARQILEEQAVAGDEQKSELEPVQAPIVGRKKKAKKPAASNPKPTPAPTKIQAASPQHATVEEESEEESKPVVASTSEPKTHGAKASETSFRQSPTLPQQDPDELKEKGQPTAQSIIADLQKTGELLASTLEFFKPLSSSLAHAARTSSSSNPSAPPDLKIHFSEAHLDALAKKKPVRVKGQDGRPDSRTLITPQGKFFWGLTQELEEKALELEKHIEELKGSTRFHPRKQTTHSHTRKTGTRPQSQDVLPAIATALKESGSIPKIDSASTLPGPSPLPLPSMQAPPAGDPHILWSPLPSVPPSQLHSPREPPADAVTYLNQFILPERDSLPRGKQRPEMEAVGGLPGTGMANMSVNVNKIAKAAKVVAEGGSVGTELEGMSVMASDLLGGVVVQGLEALVGAGLGLNSTQDLGVDGLGNIMHGSGLDVQELVDAIGSGGGISGFSGGHSGGRRGRRSVLSVEEAEQAMLAAKKDHEALEKRLAALMKRNKKMVSGAGKA